MVTGGSAGVGRATAELLARRGYDVAVMARGGAGLAGAVEDIERQGRRGLGLDVDVSDDKAVQEAVERCEIELGEIDAWVNDAFVGTLAFSWDTSIEEFRRVMDVTFFGQVHGTLTALSLMRPRDRGVIVNVGSAMAVRSIPLQGPLLRRQARGEGFQRVRDDRARAGKEQGPRLHGAAAGPQHPAVRREPVQDAGPPRADAADL